MVGSHRRKGMLHDRMLKAASRGVLVGSKFKIQSHQSHPQKFAKGDQRGGFIEESILHIVSSTGEDVL